MNKVAASWRGAGGCLPWPARSGATHDQPCRFLTCLCLYLAMSMAINGGIILSEQDLLDALIL